MKKLLILALIIGGPVWWFWGRTLEPARVIHAQLEAISRGDYDRAYSYLSTKAKEQLSAQGFKRQWRGIMSFDRITPLNFSLAR